MASTGPLRPRLPEPPSLHGRAIEDLKYIRETMVRTSSFTAVSGWGMVVIGIVALGASYAASRQINGRTWYKIWIADAILSAAISWLAMHLKVRRAQMDLLSSPVRKVLLGFAPPAIAGAIMTLVLLRVGSFGTIPGTWLLLYGAGVVTGGAFSTKVLPVMGVCFMCAGCIALFGPASSINWLMAAAFGGLHVIFGGIIIRRHGG